MRLRFVLGLGIVYSYPVAPVATGFDGVSVGEGVHGQTCLRHLVQQVHRRLRQVIIRQVIMKRSQHISSQSWCLFTCKKERTGCTSIARDDKKTPDHHYSARNKKTRQNCSVVLVAHDGTQGMLVVDPALTCRGGCIKPTPTAYSSVLFFAGCHHPSLKGFDRLNPNPGILLVETKPHTELID